MPGDVEKTDFPPLATATEEFGDDLPRLRAGFTYLLNLLTCRRTQVEMSGQTHGTDSSSECVPLPKVILCQLGSYPVLR